MRRVLLVSNDPVGSRMAGPGIRYLHFARELSRRFEVVLVVPSPPDVDLGVEVVEAGRLRGRGLVRLARGADAVVSQQLSVFTMRALARTDAKVIYDLYDPLLVENLPLFAEQPRNGREASFAAVATSQLTALATGDAFICASERQRDLWLGALGALGRLDVGRYEADPRLRELVDVVPFGLESEPPRPGEPVLRGVRPGIGPDDRVLVWGGGVWSWFDPLTVIRAVALLARERDDVRLLFLGTRPPKEAIGPMSMIGRAEALAGELGVRDESVFFNEGWVPYEERGRYFAESDLGVSAHLDHVETRFAFRTRLLDYFWAGLPTVTTGGDVLGDLVGERGLGRTVACADPEAFAGAVSSLLGSPDEYAAARRALEGVRADFAWPVVTRPLARLIESPRAASRPGRGTLLAVRSSTLALRGAAAGGGVRHAARLVGERLTSPRVP
jgi:glycosyltransferase involved in cell wall biosynthesis